MHPATEHKLSVALFWIAIPLIGGGLYWMVDSLPPPAVETRQTDAERDCISCGYEAARAGANAESNPYRGNATFNNWAEEKARLWLVGWSQYHNEHQ